MFAVHSNSIVAPKNALIEINLIKLHEKAQRRIKEKCKKVAAPK